MIEFIVKKGLLGSYTVAYDCPRCKSGLKSRLDDAGTSDTCPDCGTGFIVPGKEERDRIHHEQAVGAQRTLEAKELARKKRELECEEERKQQAAARAAEIQSQQPKTEPSPLVPLDDEAIHCPQCGSSQVTANKKGFGLGKAAVGGLLLGPVGLLGGMIGGGKIKITCLKCGHVFEPGQGK